MRGHSDTETLLAAFDAWGIDKTLSLCVGMFAMAIWDLKNLELTLVVIGLEKSHYIMDGLEIVKKSLVFGSDLNALKQFNNFDPTIDRNSLSQYIRYGYVGDDRSIYKGIIKKLLPANKIIISSKNLTSKTDCYWSANDIFNKDIL